MTIEEIKQKTKDVVLNLLPDISSEELTEDTDIFGLGLDSINAMTLVFNLQDAFDIQFESNEISFENFRTVADIVELIKTKKNIYEQTVS
ncbi:acyl carrier protein [Pleurocapsales cyanobacterium LEGE 06147]|nr:acyl carrier protein [Pleurocapsales cyanobacterium LEGE 06147]